MLDLATSDDPTAYCTDRALNKVNILNHVVASGTNLRVVTDTIRGKLSIVNAALLWKSMLTIKILTTVALLNNDVQYMI